MYRQKIKKTSYKYERFLKPIHEKKTDKLIDKFTIIY